MALCLNVNVKVSVILISVITRSVIMRSVIMLNAVRLRVMAPIKLETYAPNIMSIPLPLIFFFLIDPTIVKISLSLFLHFSLQTLATKLYFLR